MDFSIIQKRALEIRNKYDELNRQKNGKAWTTEQIMEGFVGDVGDLMKLVMAKSGARKIDQVDEKIKHELSDCMWCILVLASKYNINMEEEFLKTMEMLDSRIASEMA